MAHTTATGIAAHIAVTNGEPTTTTQDIAEVYGRRHEYVLKIVRQRMTEAGEWGVPNFWETPYTNPQNGQTYTVIRMTEKGFYFVVGKFTGAKAVAHQIAYAEEFDRMKAALGTPDKKTASNGETINVTLNRWAMQLAEPNSYPPEIFLPLVDSVLKKLGLLVVRPVQIGRDLARNPKPLS